MKILASSPLTLLQLSTAAERAPEESSNPGWLLGIWLSRRRRGGDLITSTHGEARRISKKAHGKVVRDEPHRPGYSQHYHSKKRDRGHTWFD